MHDETVSLAEAARLAHVTRGTIQHWIRTGRLAIHHVPPRKKLAVDRNPHATRRYNARVLVKDVLACSFAQRMRQLKQQHADLNLLTVREFAALCGRSTNWSYQVVKSLGLKKFYLDAMTYLVSGVEFWEKSQDHPHYAQLFLKK